MADFRITLLAILLIGISSCRASYLLLDSGVLKANNGTTQESFCVYFYPKLSSYSSENGVFMPLLDLSSWNACEVFQPEETASFMGHTVMVNQKGNCSIIEKAQTIERLGGKGMIIVVSAKLTDLSANDNYPALIPIALLCPGFKQILQGLGSSVKVAISSPILKQDYVISSPIMKQDFNYNFLAISAFAILAVGIGSYWGGLDQHHLITKPTRAHIYLIYTPMSEVSSICNLVTHILCWTVSILMFCGIVVALLVLIIYLAISYTVSFTIATFVVPSILAFYSCLKPIFRRIPMGTVELRKIKIHVNKLVLFVACVALVSCWTVYRKENFAWILLDILSLTLSIVTIRKVRMPSLRLFTIVVALSILITAAILIIVAIALVQSSLIPMDIVEAVSVANSSSGNSSVELASPALSFIEMMVEEQLPWAIRFPHMGYYPLSVCRSDSVQQYTLFFFHTLFVPGYLIGYCHSFDLARGNRSKIYYITTLVAYSSSFLTPFVDVHLTANTKLLVDLFSIPFTLAPILILGLCRREMKLLWKGGKQATLPMVEKKQLAAKNPPKEESTEFTNVVTFLVPHKLESLPTAVNVPSKSEMN